MADQLPTIRVLGFRTEYKPGKDGKSRAIDIVKYAPVSAIMTNQVEDRIEFLRPPDALDNDDDGKKIAFMRHRWSMIEPAYTAWKEGQEIPVNGTPLGAWPAVTKEQVEVLHRLGLRTVEEMSELTDTTITKIPLPNARDLKKQAHLFLESTDRATAAQEMADRDKRIASLEEQLAAAMELLEENVGKKKPKKQPEKAESQNEAA